MSKSFAACFEDLHLLKHPFYQAWMAGELRPESLRDYACQYSYHVNRFPRYLSAIHSNCENPAWRRDLLENLNDEEGLLHGTSHPDLWLQFAEGLGLSANEVAQAEPREAIRKVADTFFSFARSSFHEGLGALYAYESQVPEIATSKIEGLRRRYDIGSDRALAFFSVHEKADLEHRRVIGEILEALPENERAQAQSAARVSAQALWDFLSDVHSIGNLNQAS